MPALQDVMQCMQTHAALLPLVRTDQRYLVHYRRGYCALFGAVVTKDAADYQEAAREFTQAWEGWPARMQTVSSGLLALVGIARIGNGASAAPPEALRVLETAAAQAECSQTALMRASFCGELVETARVWLGYEAYRADRLADALRLFQAAPGSTWSVWAAGRQAWVERRWPQSVALMQSAIDAWTKANQNSSPGTLTLFGPKPDLGRCYYELATALFRMEEYKRALVALNEALERNPSNSFAVFLRARSKDALAESGAAADYLRSAKLADQTKDGSWAVGQAYYYRGLLLYREKRYTEAVQALELAPKNGLGELSRQTVTAWTSLAEVAGGDCEKAGELTDANQELKASGFPVAEAQAFVTECQLKRATTLEQLLAVERQIGPKLTPVQNRDLRRRIGARYAEQGLAAEDRKDVNAAVAAYQKAIEYDPASGKAHFNLGAIYLESRRFQLAEEEYRTLVQTNASDYEAQYWLAESILAQPLTPERKLEACELLKQSLATNDAEQKAQSMKTATRR